MRNFLASFFFTRKQGDAGVHCGQHPTKTPQCSCDMKKGRFLHVPADSLSHSHGDQQLFGSLLGFFVSSCCFPIKICGTF